MARKRQRRRCKAQCADDGRPCPNWAMTGQQVCASHGGITRQAKAAAARRAAEAKAVEVYRAYSPNGDNTPVDVVGELVDLVREVRRFRDFLGSRVSELSADQWSYEHPARERIAAEIGLYERALDRSGRLLADVARLGLLEELTAAVTRRRVQLERARVRRSSAP